MAMSPRSGAPRKGGPKKQSASKRTGAPKQRWSSDEKRVRAQIADTTGKKRFSRERDLAPHVERDERPRNDRFNRDDRPRQDRFSRDDRPRNDRFSRDDRPQRFERDDRPRNDRFNRDDRPQRFERDDRPRNDRFNRDDRPRNDRFSRDDRPQRFEREDRPRNDRFNRDDRPRNDRFSRDDRPQRFEREDRPRQERFNRDDRPQRFNRDDRPQRFERDDRPRQDRFNRDDRPAREDRFQRDERPSFGRGGRDQRAWFDDNRADRPQREDRPARFERDDRPARFEREDRPARFERDDRPRDDRPRHDRPRRFEERPARPQRAHRPLNTFSAQRRHERLDIDEGTADTMEWSQAETREGGSGETAFAALGLPRNLVVALSGQGIETPFPIQEITIPDALAGRDVLGRAETGSGKTLAFGLPLLARLSASEHSKEPRAIVLVPTRELAVQVADALSPLAGGLGLRVALVAGGMSYTPQLRAFQRGVDVVIATPGRMIDLMEQGAVDLSRVEVTVLDEADHMADLGFLPAVTQIVDATPADGQRLLFSATLDNAVASLVKRYMHDPITHEIDSGRASVETMSHHVLHVQGHDKSAVAANIVNRPGKTIVFVRTQLGADRVASNLQAAGVLAAALHGGLTQGARVRVLNAFKNGTIPVVVATDVAARGIHVDDVSLVLQLDPPAGPKDYLHRAGRTARAGQEGVVVTIAQPNQRKQLQRLMSDAGVQVDPVRVSGTDEIVSTISGGAPASGNAVDPDDVAALLAPARPQRREGGRKPFRRRPGY